MSRIAEKRRALELLCRKVNPPHEPEVYRTIGPGEWAEGGIDFGKTDWRYAYLRGLNIQNITLPLGEGAFFGAVIDEVARPIQVPRIFPVIGEIGKVSTIAQLADGSLVAGTFEGDVLRLWPGTGQRQYLGKHRGAVSSVCGLKGGLLASGSCDKTVRIWDVKSGEGVRTLEGHSRAVYSVCGLEGGLLASGSDDKTVRIWDVKSGEGVRTLEGHQDYVRSVCGLEGGLLASGSDDKTVRIWDVKSGEGVRTLEGHSYSVTSVCGLEGGLLASGSDDNTVRIWDVNSGKSVQVGWAFDDLQVRVHREQGITVSTSKQAFDVQKVGNYVLPADKELYERISFAVRDKAHAGDPDGPISYVPLYAYNPGKPGEPDAAWYWHDDSYRALTCPWPKDPEMRKRVMALYFGDEAE